MIWENIVIFAPILSDNQIFVGLEMSISGVPRMAFASLA
jgi:hypothetical protein